MTDTPALTPEKVAELAAKATPGPWAIETCGEKGDGSYMIGVVFTQNDADCDDQLSGFLEEADEDGNEIEYYRDELVADCEHRNRNSGNNAEFIAAAPDMAVLIARLDAENRRKDAEVERLSESNHDLVELFDDRSEALMEIHEKDEKIATLTSRLARMEKALKDIAYGDGVPDSILENREIFCEKIGPWFQGVARAALAEQESGT